MKSSTILPNGSLWRDREYALFDGQGAFLNAKRNAKVHALRVRYDTHLTLAHLTSSLLDETFSFTFGDATALLEDWLGRHFDQPVFVRKDGAGGFPDDLKAPGPTIVSTATLETVATWLREIDVASIRDRLRSNLELGDTPAFWEDRLFGEAGCVVAFRVGDVAFEGTNPCARCVVPARDALTGETLPGFAKLVAGKRAVTLPAWTSRARFDHYYRLATNTRTPSGEAGKVVAIGAPVTLCE